ncbi:hypothetical protein N8D77_12190 [Curtobacterium flaccumfaciens]|uniref:hypothetical protein n=1 Tax=Curtobacterium TaxID=2034 RepID=UPI000F476BB6|nr:MULTISPECIES: hypothetical protein [Curtobacterium]ROR36413.1 hypothetical protein EDF63_0533 [Curtobacterium sp. JUb34]UXN20913.1 hypothetical protein N8D77_12190 [Curtobacterium flaccumfaciens pv. flaccumfaciens]
MSDGEFRASSISDEAVYRLSEALRPLVDDVDLTLDAIASALEIVKPRQSPWRDRVADVTEELIERGAYGEAEQFDTVNSATRLHLVLDPDDQTAVDLTMSRRWVLELLSWTPEELDEAFSVGKLVAVEVFGLLRFPRWQFNAEKACLVAGLPEFIRRMPAGWRVRDADDFFITPHPELVVQQPQSPETWLRSGKNSDAVAAIIAALPPIDA